MIFGNLFNLPSINCEIELDLSCSKDCIISQTSRVHAVAASSAVNPPTAVWSDTKTTGTTFQINSIKLYDPVLTLPINDKMKFLENIKEGFKKNNFLE